MNTKATIGALALDLHRVAQSYYRGSLSVAERFMQEAELRRDELQSTAVTPYIKKLLTKVAALRKEKDIMKKAEDALMYSVLFQNAARFL